MVVLVGKFSTILKSATSQVSHSHHKLIPRMISRMMSSSPHRCKLEPIEGKKTLVLTLTNTKDQHLLDPDFIQSIRNLLDEAKREATRTRGSVLITTAQGDSFCRGFDYRCGELIKTMDGFEDLVSDMISLPMPTIAAVNGYATGAGLMLAICHDYLIMKPNVDSLRSEHLANKTTLPASFAALLRSKVSSPMDRRDLVLRDLQFNSQDAAQIGLIDKKSSAQKTDFFKQAETLAQTLSEQKVDGEVYAELRKAMLPDLCNVLGLTCTTILPKL